MGDRVAAVAFGGDYRLDMGFGDLFADSVGIVTAIRKERLDLVADHPEQGRKPVHIVGLPWRQDVSEWTPLSITSGVELGGEPAARSAKRLGFLSPFFMPTAQ